MKTVKSFTLDEKHLEILEKYAKEYEGNLSFALRKAIELLRCELEKKNKKAS